MINFLSIFNSKNKCLNYLIIMSQSLITSYCPYLLSRLSHSENRSISFSLIRLWLLLLTSRTCYEIDRWNFTRRHSSNSSFLGTTLRLWLHFRRNWNCFLKWLGGWRCCSLILHLWSLSNCWLISYS